MNIAKTLSLVILINLLGCSQDNSTIVTVDQTLSAPTSITAVRIGLRAVRINWSDNNVAEEGYIIERRTGQGSFAQQIFTTRDAATAVDSVGLGVNSTYGYRLRAIRYFERGEYSPVATINLALPFP